MIHRGDLFDVLPGLEPDSIDACVTDPPYDLTANKRGGSGVASVNLDTPYGRARIGTGNGRGGFMGKEWDATGVAFNVETWRLVLRVLKPGAHVVAFGGPRTFHRMTCAIEDAGFEIRDCLSWLYGSGFPKSLDVSKAIDNAAGAERDIVGVDKGMAQRGAAPSSKYEKGPNGWERPNGRYNVFNQTGNITAPSTDAAKQWHGWGTALKPAWEPVILARKPLRGTVAANVQQYGTGAINVDACRIGTSKDVPASMPKDRRGHGIYGAFATHDGGDGQDPNVGRWPANVILDEAAAALLDQQSGELAPRANQGPSVATSGTSTSYNINVPRRSGAEYNYDVGGGASRFYYVAKPSREERDYGIRESRNLHPTVKPVEVMRWLVRLVTPPDGVVLDPFCGSGTTGMACRYEHRRFVGIERDPMYADIAERRVGAVAPLFAAEAE